MNTEAADVGWVWAGQEVLRTQQVVWSSETDSCQSVSEQTASCSESLCTQQSFPPLCGPDLGRIPGVAGQNRLLWLRPMWRLKGVWRIRVPSSGFRFSGWFQNHGGKVEFLFHSCSKKLFLPLKGDKLEPQSQKLWSLNGSWTRFRPRPCLTSPSTLHTHSVTHTPHLRPRSSV